MTLILADFMTSSQFWNRNSIEVWMIFLGRLEQKIEAVFRHLSLIHTRKHFYSSRDTALGAIAAALGGKMGQRVSRHNVYDPDKVETRRTAATDDDRGY